MVQNSLCRKGFILAFRLPVLEGRQGGDWRGANHTGDAADWHASSGGSATSGDSTDHTGLGPAPILSLENATQTHPQAIVMEVTLHLRSPLPRFDSWLSHHNRHVGNNDI